MIKIKIKAFLSTLRNSVFLDCYYNAVYGDRNRKYKDIVAPYKLKNLRDRWGLVFHAFYFIGICLLPVLIFVISLFKLFYILYIKITKYRRLFPVKDIKSVIILTQGYVLRTSSRLNEFEDSVVLLPLFSKKKVGIIQEQVHSEQLLSYQSVFCSFIATLRLIPIVVEKHGYRNLLYVMNAYEWFLMYDILNTSIPIESTIIFSNQKDRWAVLFDNVRQKEKVLVQHGTNIFKQIPIEDSAIFFKVFSKYNSWVLDMPYKYHTINKLYSFTEIEADHHLLSEFAVKPTVKLVGYNLSLSKYESNRTVVLVIGNAKLHSEEELFILENLDSVKFDILVKPHPLTNKTLYLKLINRVTIVDYTPTVDYVISYSSTLGYEYESLGIDVSYYKDMSTASYILEKFKLIS